MSETEFHESNHLWNGYVRCVAAACLGNEGHMVTGIDSDINKVDLINSAQSPIIETGLNELLQKPPSGGCLRAAARCENLGDAYPYHLERFAR